MADTIKKENIGVNPKEEKDTMEEISLKEIIQIVLKGKYIIIASTVIALALGIGYHKLTPKLYKSTASILANPITTQMDSTDYTNILKIPDMDISSYSEQFLNNYTLAMTIEELDLRDAEGEYITYDALKANVTVDNPSKTNILNIEVTDADPEMAASIANTLGRHFVDYISNVYQTSAGSSVEQISNQLEIEEANLDKEAEKLNEYLSNSINIDTLNSEISSLISQVTGYRSTINDLERSIDNDKATLALLRESVDIGMLDSSDLDLNINVTSSQFYSGQYQIQLNTDSGNDLQKMLLTLKMTDIETRLLENINSLASLQKKTEELNKKLSELQATRANEQYKYNAIMRTYNMAESLYSTYTTQYAQARVLETSNLGSINIKIISEAVPPINASNKNIMLTGAIAGVLGVFVSVFIVLFINYWKTEDEKPAQSQTVTM